LLRTHLSLAVAFFPVFFFFCVGLADFSSRCLLLAPSFARILVSSVGCYTDNNRQTFNSLCIKKIGMTRSLLELGQKALIHAESVRQSKFCACSPPEAFRAGLHRF
jgi:hypothetical protein